MDTQVEFTQCVKMWASTVCTCRLQTNTASEDMINYNIYMYMYM